MKTANCRNVIVAAIGAIALLAGGCSTTRDFRVTTQPPGATVKVDGVEIGRSPVAAKVIFSGSSEVHTISASRLGCVDQSVKVTTETPPTIAMELRPLTRTVRVNVGPFPATISIDGKIATARPTAAFSKEMEFTTDDKGTWTSYRIKVERLGFQTVERTISGQDSDLTLSISLAPMLKDVTISSTPAGASVYLDGRNVGKTPLTEKQIPFTTDPQTNQWGYYKLRLLKPGYDPVEQQLGWEEGKTDYAFDLKPITKVVKIIPNPPNAVVTIDGKEYPNEKDGSVVASLPFSPNADGEARIYKVNITRKTAESEWEPAAVSIGWDDGKTDYPVALKEIRTTLVETLLAVPDRTAAGVWQIGPQVVKTLARKDVAEGVGKSQPVKLTNLAKGSMIDTLTAGADGTIVFAVLEVREKADLRSRLKLFKADGSPGVRDVTDGKSLDLHPSFTPDGKDIVYSSDRGGRQHIWKLAASGEGGITQLTNEETLDIWPTIDPSGKLYYQGFANKQEDPRVYMVEVFKSGRTDMAQGTQPRISPDNTSLLLCQKNEKTGNRDLVLHKIEEKRIVPTNITRTPEDDEFDACWSPDGRRVAFVSNRGQDEDHRRNYDIWIIEVARPDAPVQVTTNGSWDDCPAWSAKADAIYFRSNRGGEWAIWKIDLPKER